MIYSNQGKRYWPNIQYKFNQYRLEPPTCTGIYDTIIQNMIFQINNNFTFDKTLKFVKLYLTDWKITNCIGFSIVLKLDCVCVQNLKICTRKPEWIGQININGTQFYTL